MDPSNPLAAFMDASGQNPLIGRDDTSAAIPPHPHASSVPAIHRTYLGEKGAFLLSCMEWLRRDLTHTMGLLNTDLSHRGAMIPPQDYSILESMHDNHNIRYNNLEMAHLHGPTISLERRTFLMAAFKKRYAGDRIRAYREFGPGHSMWGKKKEIEMMVHILDRARLDLVRLRDVFRPPTRMAEGLNEVMGTVEVLT
jgi:hypothetical protein